MKILMRKMKDVFLAETRRRHASITETLILQKVANILVSLCEGEWFSYLFSVLSKISYKLEKMEKVQKNSLITLFARTNPERKNFDVTLSLKYSLHNPRKINETKNPIFGSGHEI